VEPMAPPGAEFFIGIQRHPCFGLLISFGTGGIWLELIKDVSFRLLPATRGDLLEMFQELRSWPRLRQGFRHLPPVNPEPLVDIMEQIGSMSLEWPVLMEMDLNPVIAGPEGAVVADARIVLRERTLEAQYIVKSCS
ncbi:MAG: acetate--CoA ligase family protein, partial [Syntrophobacteraceae bacterium]